MCLDVRRRKYRCARDRHDLQWQLVNRGHGSMRQDKAAFTLYNVKDLPQVDERKVQGVSPELCSQEQLFYTTSPRFALQVSQHGKTIERIRRWISGHEISLCVVQPGVRPANGLL